MITINDACIRFIKIQEQLVLKAYHGSADAPNIYTIGYGTIVYPPNYMKGRRVQPGDVITADQAEDFLRYEVNLKAELIDPYLRDDLTPNQFAALISFTYNLGEGALKQSHLRAKVNANPADPSIFTYTLAGNGLAVPDSCEFTKWCYANGVIVNGLIKRRMLEANLYNSN
ncbi:MAG TPA: lysozyme [Puia sp.]|jgi:lysozyme